MPQCCFVLALGVAVVVAVRGLPVGQEHIAMMFLPSDFYAGGCPSSAPPPIMYVPRAHYLREVMTQFNLSLAYAAITPRISRHSLVAFVYDRFLEFTGIVIDDDGYVFDLLNPNMDLDVLFGGEDDPSWSWCGDFLSARMRVPKQNAAMKIAARYKLLWIALAIHNPAAARDVLR
jgi:hypothetical protein